MLTPNVPLCFVDTETTGLDPHTRAVWEVAMIRVEPDGTERRKEFFVELTNREFVLADSVSLEIGKFDERYDPVEAFSKRAAAAYIADFMDKAHVLGMVPDFDTLGLSVILDSVGIKPNWYYQAIDVDVFAAGVMLAKRRILNWPVDTEAFTKFLGVEIDADKRHTAMGDADWTKRFYEATIAYALED